jgi:hypothetical protein
MTIGFPKSKPNRGDAYLAWVRAQPSVESGSIGCVAHHIVGHGRCSTSKSSDFLAIPLTDAEHKRLHDQGWREWEARCGSQLEHAARLLDQAIAAGILQLDARAALRAAA